MFRLSFKKILRGSCFVFVAILACRFFVHFLFFYILDVDLFLSNLHMTFFFNSKTIVRKPVFGTKYLFPNSTLLFFLKSVVLLLNQITNLKPGKYFRN